MSQIKLEKTVVTNRANFGTNSVDVWPSNALQDDVILHHKTQQAIIQSGIVMPTDSATLSSAIVSSRDMTVCIRSAETLTNSITQGVSKIGHVDHLIDVTIPTTSLTSAKRYRNFVHSAVGHVVLAPVDTAVTIGDGPINGQFRGLSYLINIDEGSYKGTEPNITYSVSITLRVYFQPSDNMFYLVATTKDIASDNAILMWTTTIKLPDLIAYPLVLTTTNNNEEVFFIPIVVDLEDQTVYGYQLQTQGGYTQLTNDLTWTSRFSLDELSMARILDISDSRYQGYHPVDVYPSAKCSLPDFSVSNDIGAKVRDNLVASQGVVIKEEFTEEYYDYIDQTIAEQVSQKLDSDYIRS